MMKKLLMSAICAGALASVAAPALAQVVIVREHPPAARVERTPLAREGYVWAPGYWDWRKGRHVWVRGHWERDRPGYVYHQSTWVERDGRWEMRRGGWMRGDRDGDGVHNRHDRDRDGDGVRNRDDSHPNNPRRD